MERSARQYQALADPAFFIAYQEKHDTFSETMRLFSEMALKPPQRGLLEDLEREEAKLHTLVTTTSLENDNHLVKSFIKLSDAAKVILQQNTKLIDVEVEAIQSEARHLQQRMFWQGALLIPIVIVLGGVMVILITRPIRAIDASIRQLGDGELTTPIKLSGPNDFELLGQRLDWLRTRLAEVEEQKLKFLRHISHELKTPLTNIREGAELLHEGVAGDLNGKQKEISDIIRDNSLQLQSLIENLLRFSVAQVQQTKLNKSRFQFDRLVLDSIEKHNISLFSKQIDVRRFIEPMWCYADQEKLRTIVDNLIANACKFAPHNSRIDVRLSKQGEDAVFEIVDYGPGIPMNERELIFDPFYQGSGEYVSHVKGTGLGLSIAREFVVAHQGVISVIDGEQSGAHFVVRLPVLDQINQ